MNYYLPPALTDSRLRIAVVGVGGTGGEVLNALTRLDFGLKALGNKHGIHVTAFDDDVVEKANIGRQSFSTSDIGTYKSITQIHRINMFYATDWVGEPRCFEPENESLGCYDLIIGCVDKASFRVELGKIAAQGHEHHRPLLWLDMGNGQHTGQCVLGHVVTAYDEKLRLPTVFDLYPDLINPKHDNDEAPRCSLAEALQHQDLFINATLATTGMNIVWDLLTKGVISHHGVTVDTQTLKSSPMMIDEATWDFYGYQASRSAA